MKQFISLTLLLIVLSSCTGGEDINTPSAVDTETQAEISETNTAIEEEMQNLDAEINDMDAMSNDNVMINEEQNVEEDSASGPVSVKAEYTNPAQDVYIDMQYTLDSDGKISSIDAIDTNYKKSEELPKLQENLQALIGKSLDEIDDTYIAGGSLTVPAVKEALSSNS